MGMAFGTYGKKRSAHRILVGKPERKRPLRRPGRRWVDNIEMDIRKIGCNGTDWIDLAQDRDQLKALANTVMNHRGSIKCLDTLEWLSYWWFLKKKSTPLS
jgi:hypothetical protein